LSHHKSLPSGADVMMTLLHFSVGQQTSR